MGGTPVPLILACNGSASSQLLLHFFIVGASNQIVNTGLVVIGKTNQHFNWDIPGAGFVMGIGTLADMQDITDLFLGQVGVCPKVLNSLKFHWFTSFSSVEFPLENPFRKYKSERNALLQFRAKWAIMNFIYLLSMSLGSGFQADQQHFYNCAVLSQLSFFDLLFVFIPEKFLMAEWFEIRGQTVSAERNKIVCKRFISGNFRYGGMPGPGGSGCK